MKKLMKLELQRIDLRPYIISSVIFGIVILALTYFVAYVAQVEHEVEFMNYQNIFRFTSAISIVLFGVLSATMYTKLVIGEYSGKRLALLFSYPVSRKKIFVAKVLIVLSFVCASMLLCTVIPITMFTATELIVPIVSDVITASLLVQAFKMVAVSLAAVSAIGLLAMQIGFIKKSITVTLVSAFLLAGIYGNIVVHLSKNTLASLLLIGVSLMGVVVALVMLTNNLAQMEVE